MPRSLLHFPESNETGAENRRILGCRVEIGLYSFANGPVPKALQAARRTTRKGGPGVAKGGVIVPNSDPHAHIARKLQSIETAKVELVRQAAEVLRAISRGSERDMTQALGGVVGVSYFLASQLGLSLDAVDREASDGLPHALPPAALGAADYEAIHRHLRPAR